MDINRVQQSLFPRQVNPAQGSDQQHREQGREMADQLQQAEARQRAGSLDSAAREQELWRPERRLDGRLVRVGPTYTPVADADQARSNLMREKIARTYSPERESGPATSANQGRPQDTPLRSRDPLDLVV